MGASQGLRATAARRLRSGAAAVAPGLLPYLQSTRKMSTNAVTSPLAPRYYGVRPLGSVHLDQFVGPAAPAMPPGAGSGRRTGGRAAGPGTRRAAEGRPPGPPGARPARRMARAAGAARWAGPRVRAGPAAGGRWGARSGPGPSSRPVRPCVRSAGSSASVGARGRGRPGRGAAAGVPLWRARTCRPAVGGCPRAWARAGVWQGEGTRSSELRETQSTE